MLAGALLAGLTSVGQRPALAGNVGITYVKTIGQVWPELPMMTGGGRLSVDTEGNLYAGTPGANSFLQKISPDGRVIWRADDTHNAYYGTAVDDEYVYGSGQGYYGWGHLQRRKKTSGEVPPGWKFVWKKPTDIEGGVRGFVHPGPLLVNETHLYVLDTGNGEVRRLDKESGEEKSFETPVKLPGAFDMAFSRSGSLLVLVNPLADDDPKVITALPAGAPVPTISYVAELDAQTGAVLQPALISGLTRSAALAVHPATGQIYVGEGGSPLQPVNKVRVFSPAGAATGESYGRGGEWQGPWAPEALAFSAGSADIAFDPEGGWWTNAFGGRMRTLGLLVHFSPTGEADKTFVSVTGDSVAVDGDLNVAVGGNYKITWDGRISWTSGLVSTGAPNQFPTTIDYWTVRPVYLDARKSIFVNVHGPALFNLNAASGELVGQALPLPLPIVQGTATLGQNIYVLGGGKIHRTNTTLSPLQTFWAVPEDLVKRGPNGLALSADEKTVFLSSGSAAAARVHAYRNDAPLWEAKAGTILTRHKNILLTTNPAGPGILVLDTDDGSVSAVIGNAPLDDRPALTGITGAAIGSKRGIDYLFVACAQRVLVYRIVIADKATATGAAATGATATGATAAI